MRPMVNKAKIDKFINELESEGQREAVEVAIALHQRHPQPPSLAYGAALVELWSSIGLRLGHKELGGDSGEDLCLTEWCELVSLLLPEMGLDTAGWRKTYWGSKEAEIAIKTRELLDAWRSDPLVEFL